jgi:hypothetical protein
MLKIQGLMSSPTLPSRLKLAQFADHFRNEMVPLANRICYFAAAVPLNEEDRRELLEEPIAALPPSIAALLPEMRILLVPYLCRSRAHRKRESEETFISTEPPDSREAVDSSTVMVRDGAVLAFAVKGADVADHHYRFYRAIAELTADSLPEGIPQEYAALLETELKAGVHGEVDEGAWRLKNELTRRDRNFRRPTDRLKQYIRQSFIDTLTLYLHGICCDIDVEPGPRQIPSNWLRKRLTLLKTLFPPPQGYAVFPEDL